MKMECFQPTGSFKIRGIGLLCTEKASSTTEFVCSSGGNAGMAAAFAARKLNKPVTIFVPTTTPQTSIDSLRRENAQVIVHGAVWDEAHARTMEEASKPGVTLVHPFDDPIIWRGHATIIDECRQQMQKAPDAIIVSVGGGGLLCGVLEGLHKVNDEWTLVPVICAETKGTCKFAKSLSSGQLVTLEKIESIASTLASKIVSEVAFDWRKKHRLLSCVVSDTEAVQGCRDMLLAHRVVVEPSCGTAIAALAHVETLLGKKPNSVLVIACGGIGGKTNIDEYKPVLL